MLNIFSGAISHLYMFFVKVFVNTFYSFLKLSCLISNGWNLRVLYQVPFQIQSLQIFFFPFGLFSFSCVFLKEQKFMNFCTISCLGFNWDCIKSIDKFGGSDILITLFSDLWIKYLSAFIFVFFNFSNILQFQDTSFSHLLTNIPKTTMFFML